MGFAAMAGGLAGGISVMVLKYVTQGAEGITLWYGASNLVSNALVMLRFVMPFYVQLTSALTNNSSVALWVSQNMEDDYTYNLAL